MEDLNVFMRPMKKTKVKITNRLIGKMRDKLRV